MKLFENLVIKLLAPRVISDESRDKLDPLGQFFDQVILPIVVPGYERPKIKLLRIETSSSRRNVTK